MSVELSPIKLTTLSDAGDFDAVLCDAWGVIHNGLVAKKAAVRALEAIKARGVPVIILTNAPRTQQQLIEHFSDIGVTPASYDKIVSSGEVGRRVILNSDRKKCFHLGPAIDQALFDGTGVRLVNLLSDAEFIFNSGLRDNTRESPEEYQALLNSAHALGLPMICVNPDRLVHIGKESRACAGALAEIYESLGGDVVWIGKPYPQIYQFCERELRILAMRSVDPCKILVIGDSVATDILGAKNMGYQALFILEGIHREELDSSIDFNKFYDTRGARPDFYMNALT